MTVDLSTAKTKQETLEAYDYAIDRIKEASKGDGWPVQDAALNAYFMLKEHGDTIRKTLTENTCPVDNALIKSRDDLAEIIHLFNTLGKGVKRIFLFAWLSVDAPILLEQLNKLIGTDKPDQPPC